MWLVHFQNPRNLFLCVFLEIDPHGLKGEGDGRDRRRKSEKPDMNSAKRETLSGGG